MKLDFITSLRFTFSVVAAYAQTQTTQWHHLDPTANKTMGISTDRAYELLKTLPAPTKPVIVAVIDGSIDLNHEDLKSVLWTNTKEIAGNGKDDDQNGYIDDMHGWNFLGLADGHTRVHDQKEETRLYARLKPLYEGKIRNLLSAEQQTEFDLYHQVKPYYGRKRDENRKYYQDDSLLLAADRMQIAALKKAFGVSRIDTVLLAHPPTTDSTLLRYALGCYRDMKRQNKADLDSLFLFFEHLNTGLSNNLLYDYNPDYIPQPAFGDTFTDRPKRYYGHADATGGYTEEGTSHGTHVGGIIGADRANSLGVKGIADRIQLIGVTIVPDGDERDKDVANAIRYVVDNRARIVNMSFGKYFSPEKILVDEAIRYADRKGVLLVLAAGNDQFDLDSAQTYPSPRYLNGQEVPNLITVGASDQHNNSTLLARFANYGWHTVDVFAPGVAILSTTPKDTYTPFSGASQASPMVAGMAALLKTYFSNLNPTGLKRIILQSAAPCHTQVTKPGTKQKVDFATLSKTGAVVNLYEAVKLAMAEQATTTKR